MTTTPISAGAGNDEAPRAMTTLQRAGSAAIVAVVLLLLHELALLLANKWLLDSLQLSSVFWTNFALGARLFIVGFVVFALAVAVPAFFVGVRRTHETSAALAWRGAVVAGLVGARWLAHQTHEMLLGSVDTRFNDVDPVFGNDIAFYAFLLPNLWIAWSAALAAALIALGSALFFSALTTTTTTTAPDTVGRWRAFLMRVMRRPARACVGVVGAVAAAGVWLTRYDLLTRDNLASSIASGPQYVDVTGFFSTLTSIHFTALLVLAAVLVLVRILALLATDAGDVGVRVRRLALGLVTIVALDLGFHGAVALRVELLVRPNEPVVQLPWIERHVNATRRAYGLEHVEEVELRAAAGDDALPDVESVLASPTVTNAPLWPGFTSYLERQLDTQHVERVLLSRGDPMVYGPTLEAFRQQQRLRTYYNFLGVDAVRYSVDDTTRMFVSAVREVPLHEPSPWLAFWGNRFVLYTHGYGLVLAPAAGVAGDGDPAYANPGIPVAPATPAALSTANPRVYYGEGSHSMAFSNVRGMQELDYPTDQDREQLWLPDDAGGVRIDSLAKRIVFGWLSNRFWQVVFSDLITDESRAHIIRPPLDRLQQAAPFLHYDSNPYAVAADGRVVWIVNGMTTTDRYPCSLIEELGDKGDERARFPRPTRMANYVEDSVKATIDGYSGALRLYVLSSSAQGARSHPIIAAWREVYPELFVDAAAMPPSIRRQLTYPTQLFHIQFDDVFMYYHMKEPLLFFNMEDMWDDGDDVMGPMLGSGDAITFSMEPYPLLLDTALPSSSLPPAQQPLQYALLMPFTNEGSVNLRAIPVAYQDGADYGRLVVLKLPKGTFVAGPEQSDAAIDQDPTISQYFAWWNRRGLEVTRGHTTLLPIGSELIYVEPIFLRSQQNPVPRLAKVAVVVRGRAFMDDTLERALRTAFTSIHARAPAAAAAAPTTAPGAP